VTGRRRTIAAIAAAAVVSSAGARAEALEARIAQLRMTGPRLWTIVELREFLEGNFLELVRGGRAVFVQLQADLWEDRRVFDRVVITTAPATYRIDADAGGAGVVLVDQFGGSLRHADARQPLPVRLDLGQASRIDDAATYYVHAVVTAATVDERDIDQAGTAIFGDDDSASGLAAVGRFVFRTLLRMGKYFESATAEVTSRRVTGREIRAGAF
jgi:hypothetical protein